MQITHRSAGQFELKSREAVVGLGRSITIGEYQIPGPGEYEVAGVMVEESAHTTRIVVDDFKIGFLGSGSKKLSAEELEQLGSVDILFVVVDGADSEAFSPKEFATLLGQFEAPIAIPIITDERVKQAFRELPKIEVQSGPLKITHSQLPEEGTQILLFDDNA
jgi:hypothetical protein